MSTTANMTTKEIFDVISDKLRYASSLTEDLTLHVRGYYHWWSPVDLRKKLP
jgi:hypothetical protein